MLNLLYFLDSTSNGIFESVSFSSFHSGLATIYVNLSVLATSTENDHVIPWKRASSGLGQPSRVYT